MKLRRVSVCLAAFATVIGCARERMLQTASGIDGNYYFEAVQADGSTKTVIHNETAVYWSPKDSIKIFYGTQTCGKFVGTNTTASLTTTFKGTFNTFDGSIDVGAEDPGFWGLYPYDKEAEFDGETVTVTVPSEQVAVEGSFAPDLFPAIARSSGLSLAFYNVCGGIMFTVSQSGIKSVTFRGAGNESIAGSARADIGSDGKPEVRSFISKESTITVTAPEGGSFTPGAEYYIVAFPTALPNGWSMTYYDKSGAEVSYTNSSAATIKRSVFGKIGSRDTYTFNHPCAYVNAGNISEAKKHVAAADPSDPVYACWLQLCKSPYAAETYTPSPVETVVRGDPTGTGVAKENYIICDRDAAAAFQLALRWKISGDEQYAEAAVAVLNAWASTCKKITANDNNQYLLVGFQGHTFANAAELLRDYSGWQASDQDAFKTWMRNLWYEKSHWFIENHGGANNCPLHYWSNWELANLACHVAIGIYLEDKDMLDYAKECFFSGSGSGCVNNMIPYAPVADPDGHGQIAQNMESGRDQGHATLVVSICAELCQMAENMGMGFWAAESSKVLPMCEYTAKWNVKPEGDFICTTMPFTEYKYCVGCSCKDKKHGATHTVVSASSRGKERPGWDLVYSHYVKKAGKSAYYTKLFAEQLRYTGSVLTGDCGAGDSRYGSNSSAFDQLGWGTLLFYNGD